LLNITQPDIEFCGIPHEIYRDL